MNGLTSEDLRKITSRQLFAGEQGSDQSTAGKLIDKRAPKFYVCIHKLRNHQKIRRSSSVPRRKNSLYSFFRLDLVCEQCFSMPGRRSNILNNLKNEQPKSKAGSGKRKSGRGLDALAIAEHEFPEKLGVRRHRLGDDDDFDSGRKRGFGQDDEDGPSKRRRTEDSDGSVDGGSDGEGNEWKVGQVDSDDDSDIDSENAFGSSDEERFEGFSFRASSTNKDSRKPAKGKKQSGQLLEDEDMDEELDEEIDDDDLGEDAVDLATAWDINAEESEEEKRQAAKSRKQSGRKDIKSDEESATGSEEESESEDEEDVGDDDLSLSEADDNTDTRGLSKLQRFVSALESPNKDREKSKQGPSVTLQGSEPTEFGLISSRKLTVADLLPTLSDSRMKGSLKHLHPDVAAKKTKTGGIPGKLDVPLSKREQDRIDRAAAYQKSKETLDRWIDTVKANRRAEHLSFPLPEIAPMQDTKVADTKPRTDLEATIQNILVESGLAGTNGKNAEDRIQEFEELQANKLSIEEIQARRNELRKARELLFREEVRAKRIKKIKSKSYRRVHRKERERLEQKEREALAAAGIDVDDEDRERADRLRAEMRMGAKHRESKWAKSVKQTGRAAWDDEARAGMDEQYRRKEELQRRIEGKRVDNEDHLTSSSSESDEEDFNPFDEVGSEDEAQRLMRKLGKLEGQGLKDEELTGPHAKLLSMKFMQNAEAARKVANEAEIKKLNRKLAGEESTSDLENEEGGRKRFGKGDANSKDKVAPVIFRREFEEPDSENENSARQVVETVKIRLGREQSTNTQRTTQISTRREQNRASAKDTTKDADVNPWLSEGNRQPRKKKGASNSNMEITLIDTGSTEAMAPGVSKSMSKQKPGRQGRQNTEQSDNDLSDDDLKVPVLLQNEELVKRAFAGDEVLETFTKEKLQTIEDEGDQVVEDTLPGWGSWAGSGLTKKDKKEAEAKRSFKTVEGIKPQNRKDAKLDKVIINEKRVRKVCWIHPLSSLVAQH